MKKNGIALLIVVLLGGIAFWLVKKNGNTTVAKELRDFPISDTAAITRIFMADKSNHTVTLKKIKTGEWTVNDKWKARNDGIFNLLFVMKNLAIKSLVGAPAVENVIKNLASGATKVEVYNGDKLVKVYYVGGATPDDEGTYMLLSDPETKLNSTRPFVMFIEGQTRYLSPVYSTNEKEWRDRSAFSYFPPDVRSVRLDFIQAPGHSFELQQPEPNHFNVLDLKTNSPMPGLDTLNARQYVSYLMGMGFESFIDEIPAARKDSILTSTPLYVMTITDKNKQRTELQFFGMEPHREEVDAQGRPEKYDLDRMYTLINKKEFVITQYYVFGKVLTDIEYFKKRSPVKK
ncbi:MAG: hypothetical protein ACHQRM_10045 [Bacteroidia bacterium]